MIINYGPNRTEISFMYSSVFISYATPVAYYDHKLRKIFITEKKYSATTTKHINKWVKLLVEERGFPDKKISPNSYETTTEKELKDIWNKITNKNNLNNYKELKEDITWEKGIKSRMSSILSDLDW